MNLLFVFPSFAIISLSLTVLLSLLSDEKCKKVYSLNNLNYIVLSMCTVLSNNWDFCRLSLFLLLNRNIL